VQDTFSAAEVRELLAVIAAALDPPFAAPGQLLWVRAELIEHRAAVISGALGPIVTGPAGPRNAMHLRELLNEPLGYEPLPEGGAS